MTYFINFFTSTCFLKSNVSSKAKTLISQLQIMAFKKLNTPLKDVLQHLKYEEATPFQQKVIPKIKGGRNIFAISNDGAGKSTALVINVVQKLKSAASGDNPRAVIFVKDKNAANKLKEEFRLITQQMDLRVYTIFEEKPIESQKDIIYEGVDIIITTEKRFKKLYHLNGINLNELKIIVIEDAHLFPRENFARDIIRIAESFERCQYVIFSKEYSPKLQNLKHTFMTNAQLITV